MTTEQYPAGRMEYNSSRDTLIIPEYGRNIQKMIEYTMTLAEREDRNKAAESIIRVMGQVNPLTKEDDSAQKLWDHMYIISGFKIDVDSPFDWPSPEKFTTRPEVVPYPGSQMAFKHYGRIVEGIIENVCNEPDEEVRKLKMLGLANLMKKSYLNWNRDSVHDEVIIKDLRKMSGGKLDLPIDTTLATNNDLAPLMVQQVQPQQRGGGKKKRRKGGGSNNNNNNNSNNNNNNNKNRRRNPRQN
jgi:hypothetical protein